MTNHLHDTEHLDTLLIGATAMQGPLTMPIGSLGTIRAPIAAELLIGQLLEALHIPPASVEACTIHCAAGKGVRLRLRMAPVASVDAYAAERLVGEVRRFRLEPQ